MWKQPIRREVIAGLACLVAAGCAASSDEAARPPPAAACAKTVNWASYASDRLSFQYPACWSTAKYTDGTSMFSTALVDPSDQPTHDPCSPITSSETGATG